MYAYGKPNLNAAQIATIQRLTDRIPVYNHVDGAMSYNVEPLACGKRVLLVATNARGDLKWYEKTRSCYITIGERGGIVRKHGDLTV